MKKFLLSFFALSMAMLTWANPNGNYHVTKALLHYVSSAYKFAGGDEWAIESADDEYAWDVQITTEADGACTLFNLIGDEETFYGTVDENGLITLPVQTILLEDEGEEYEQAICGGISGYTQPQALMNYVDQYGSYVTTKVLPVTLHYDEASNTITLVSPILVYTPYDAYEGYVGFASYLFSELVMAQQQEQEEEIDLYLRGSMNGWGVVDEYKFTMTINENGEHIFCLTGIEFDAYTEFKIADADWDIYDFGGWSSDGSFVPANERVFLTERGPNLTVNYNVNKNMVFIFNLDSWSFIIEGEPETPVYTAKDIYLRGDMNGWAALEEYKFTTEDNMLYTLTGVSFEAGTQFKIADVDWGEVNYGGYDEDPIIFNRYYTLSYGGMNMTTELRVTSSDIIEFSIVNGRFIIIPDFTAIENVNADSAQSKWYNLQGMEVNKAQLLPGNIYINNGKKVLVK